MTMKNKDKNENENESEFKFFFPLVPSEFVHPEYKKAHLNEVLANVKHHPGVYSAFKGTIVFPSNCARCKTSLTTHVFLATFAFKKQQEIHCVCFRCAEEMTSRSVRNKYELERTRKHRMTKLRKHLTLKEKEQKGLLTDKELKSLKSTIFSEKEAQEILDSIEIPY